MARGCFKRDCLFFIGISLFAFSNAASALAETSSASTSQIEKCGSLPTTFQKFTENFYKPVVWDEAVERRVIEKFHSALDPWKLGEPIKSEDPQLYLKAVSSNDCTYLKSVWNQALKLRQKIESDLKEEISHFEPEAVKKEFEKYQGKNFSEIEKSLRPRIYAVSLWASLQKDQDQYGLGLDRASFEKFSLDNALRSFFPALGSDSDFETLISNAFIQAFDPMDEFFKKQGATEFKKAVSSGFMGYGIFYKKIPGGLLIQSLSKGGPADKQGALRSGDLLLDDSTEKPASVEDRLSLAEGNFVDVKIKRRDQIIDLKMNRGLVEQQKVECDAKKSAPAIYCRVPVFYGEDKELKQEGAADDLLHQIVLAKSQSKTPTKGLVLDLRHNPGGYVNEAVKMSMILLAGKIENKAPLFMRRNSDQEFSILQPETKPLVEIAQNLELSPLLVLVDNRTASASEIVSENVQGGGAGLIVSDGAKHTIGKGSVQEFRELPGEDFLKVTTALYYGGDGICPHHLGVKPDIIFPITQGEDQYLEGSFTETPYPSKIGILDHRDRTQLALKSLSPEIEKLQLAITDSQSKANEEMFLNAVQKLVNLYGPMAPKIGANILDAVALEGE